MPAPDGEGTLWYGTATDIHAVRDAEERLRTDPVRARAGDARRPDRLVAARPRGPRRSTWSPELEELFGLPAGSFAGDRDRFLAFVHPDDRAGVTAAVVGAIAVGDDYVIEFRFRHADGSWRWMEGRGRATYEDGTPAMLYGIGMDISDRKTTEDAISAREERLRIAAEVGGFGLYDYDLEHDGRYWSPELHQILGTAGEAVAPADAGSTRTTARRRSSGSRPPSRRRATGPSISSTGSSGPTEPSAGCRPTARHISPTRSPAPIDGPSARSASWSTSRSASRPTSYAMCSSAC